MTEQLLIQATAQELAQLIAIQVKDYLQATPQQQYFNKDEATAFLRMPSVRGFESLNLPHSNLMAETKYGRARF